MAGKSCISKTQFDYVDERIKNICNRAIEAKKKELTTKEKHEVNDDEAAFIVENTLKRAKPHKLKIRSNYYVRLAFDFSPYENDVEYDKDAYLEFKKKINTEARKLRDRIVLCGADDALEELTAFERKYVGDE